MTTLDELRQRQGHSARGCKSCGGEPKTLLTLVLYDRKQTGTKGTTITSKQVQLCENCAPNIYLAAEREIRAETGEVGDDGDR